MFIDCDDHSYYATIGRTRKCRQQPAAAASNPQDVAVSAPGILDGQAGPPGQAGQAGQAGRGRVQSVERAVALLDAIAVGPARGSTVAELALACGINRATAWRLLATMEGRGLVDRDPATSRYQIGYTVARLAAAAGVDGLVRRAHHVLERICAQTGEAAILAVSRGAEMIYVDEVAPSA